MHSPLPPAGVRVRTSQQGQPRAAGLFKLGEPLFSSVTQGCSEFSVASAMSTMMRDPLVLTTLMVRD